APFRFLGTKFVERVMALGGSRGWMTACQEAAAATGIQARQKQSAADWVALVDDVRRRAMSDEPEGAAEILDALVRKTDYIRWLEKEEGEESIESSHAANVRELLRVAANFRTAEELLEYVDENVRESGKQKRGGPKDAVT